MLNKAQIMQRLVAKRLPFKQGMKQLAQETGKSEWMLWQIYNGKLKAHPSAPVVDFEVVTK